MSQLTLKLYEKDKITRRVKPGDIIIRECRIFRKKGSFDTIFTPSLVLTESDFSKTSLNWRLKMARKGKLPITTAYKSNLNIRVYNIRLDWNSKMEFKPLILDRARGKEVEIGQVLIKIEKVRTTYRVIKVRYDGVMSKNGFFILPKKYDNENSL